jgi:hypothetical protein
MDGDGGEPVEDSVDAGHLREQHHADEEEIDICSFGDGFSCEAEGDQAQDDEQ